MNVFLSFHPKQKYIAEHFQTHLASRTLIAKSFNLSRQLGSKIYKPELFEKAVGHQDYFLILISEDYITDNWLLIELNVFLSHEGARGRGHIVIPIVCDSAKIPQILDPGKRKSFDFLEILISGFKPLIDFLFKELMVFMVMKLGSPEFDEVYVKGIKPAIELNDLIPRRIDDNEDGKKISEQILNEIKNSQIVICDLTEERPNCYFEAGYALGLGKDLVFTAKEDTKVHFDLYDNRRIVWKSADDLNTKLSKRLKQLKDEIFNLE